MENITDKSNKKGGDKKQFQPPQIPQLNFNIGRRDPQHYTPWLVVRANYGDFGDRPLASGSVFWESPDVWVVSSLGINQPVTGENNTVFARVNNYGAQDATGVWVKFWWANPSLAITESTANLIGIGYANVPSGWSVDVQCPTPWIPIEENGGHECLIAEAFIPTFDPLTSPMDPMDDRHVGQKNEQLVMLQAGQMFHIGLEAINITNEVHELRFDIQTLHLENIHPLVQIQGLSGNPHPAHADLSLGIKVAETAVRFVKKSVLFSERLLLRGLESIEHWLEGGAEHSSVNHTVKFQPLEARTVQVSGKVPDDAEAGQTYIFRIVQRIGNMVTGGYTVNVVVV